MWWNCKRKSLTTKVIYVIDCSLAILYPFGFLLQHKRCSFYFPETFLHILYYSLIYTYFCHCIIVWALMYKPNICNLVILQKHIKNQTSLLIQTLFSKNLVYFKKIDNINNMQQGQFMYSYSNLPSRLYNCFHLHNQIHSTMNCGNQIKWRMILAVVNFFNAIRNCIKKPEKIQDFNWVWTHDIATSVRYSNQLSYEATDNGSRSTLLWVHMFPWKRWMWVMYLK